MTPMSLTMGILKLLSPRCGGIAELRPFSANALGSLSRRYGWTLKVGVLLACNCFPRPALQVSPRRVIFVRLHVGNFTWT